MAFIEINYNISETILDGYDFHGSDTVRVDAAFLVSSSQGDGIFSFWPVGTLYNFGRIAGGDDGVSFGTGSFDGVVYNESTGVITGGYAGVEVEDSGEHVDNFGTISGGKYGVLFGTSYDAGQVYNRGNISGTICGIDVLSGDGSLFNSGRIHSPDYGIYVDTPIGTTTTVTNAVTGVIAGALDAIDTAGGAIRLINHGVIHGNVACGALGANDFIRNSGEVIGRVWLFGGNDTFNGTGGTSGEIFCGAGNDRVIAGKGNLLIDVGSGNSVLTAGPGHDGFVFEYGLAGQVTRITNFQHGVDTIDLSKMVFAGLGPQRALLHFHLGAPVSAHAQIDYFKGSGILEYCPDGNAGPVHVFAVLANHPAITAGDFSLFA
jgi:Ca2+-binding RTX toxin-like protein